MRRYTIYGVLLLCLEYNGLRNSAVAFQVSRKIHFRRIPLTKTPQRHRIELSQYKQDDQDDKDETRRKRLASRVTKLAKNVVRTPLSYAMLPSKVGEVLKDATLQAVDMAVDEVIRRREGGNSDRKWDDESSTTLIDSTRLIEEAFLPLEQSLDEMERALNLAREKMNEAKTQARDAIEIIQAASIAQAEGAQAALAVAERTAVAEVYATSNDIDIDELTFEDVDYQSSEMAPPFLGEDQCLVPGEPVVRVEKAPENSRRIFAGIDIMASVDQVWSVLTDYSNLQNVVPNLVVNDVLELYEASKEKMMVDRTKSDEIQCRQIAKHLKGSLLKQVGGAKVAGVNFSARTTLEVREWPQGLPDFAHFSEETFDGKSRQQRAKDYTKTKLERYKFPRPFAISSLPTRDITMQSIEDDSGEFRLYQGVWRMQPLPGCAPPGQQAMRLTYAVEISPRSYLPVQLVEGRIVKDLKNNLEAIRDYVEGNEK